MKELNVDELYERTYAVVDLTAIRKNLENTKKSLPESTAVCAILKCDAYGHGAPPVAKSIEDIVDMFGVATVAEGYQLRRNGVWKPILDLGVAPKRSYKLMLEQDIMPSIFTVEQARDISLVAEKLGITAQFMLAVDTGMGRIGIQAMEENATDLAVEICSMPHLELEGVFTHFARADEKDKEFSQLQIERFHSFTEKLEQAGITIPIKHISNSAGIIDKLGTDFNMVRDGIALYGMRPSDQVSKDGIALTPALSWKAKISHVKKVPAATTISYGSTYVADREMEIATIPVGYGDGLPRSLSNRADLLIHGKRCKVLGRICMDQFMVDVTGLGAKQGDVATILGSDGEECIDLYEWESLGLFPYEVLCNIGKRVPRVYIRDGKPVGKKDLFKDLYPNIK